MRPVIKLKNLNQWVEAPHGGDCYFEGPSEIRGLDGKGGSEGCLLYHPNSSLTSTVTEVHCEGDVSPIHLSPFRPLLCPMDFHQGNETSNDTAEVMGSQDNNLHRQHAHSGRDKGGGESTPGSVAVPPGSPRVHCQLREVMPGPNTGTGIPWVVRGLAESPTQTPWREDQTDSQRCNTDANEGFSVGSTPFTISGEAQRSISGNVSRSLILLSLAEGSPKSSDRREPRLRT